MKRIFTSVIFILIGFTARTQSLDTLVFNDITSFVSYFNLSENELTGPGGVLLKEQFEDAQFVSIGEYHGVSEISQLSTVLLNELKHHGFDHFAVETGVFSAHKLMQLKNEEITEFYSKEWTRTGEIPIPFFDGKEDLQFLQRAKDLGFDLWGLDQEFIYGYAYLFDLLMEDLNNQTNAQSQSYQRAIHRLEELYTLKKDDDELEFFSELRDSEELNGFLSLMKETSRNNSQLVDEIRASWEIYYNWSRDLNKNLGLRNEMMKAHFKTYYTKALETEVLPKVFVKMGGYHTMKGWSPNAEYELGNLLTELAGFNGKKSLHLGFLVRYYIDNEEDGGIGDNLNFNSNWVKELTPLLSAGKKDQWAIIDLSGIKEIWINRKKYVPEQIRDRIRGFDYILIPPAIHETESHFIVAN